MIEVGEYIRTKNGNIGKVIDIDRRNYWIDRYIRKESGIPIEFLEKNSEQLKNNIVKHSKNIIDLIEVGDIVEIELSEEFVEKENKKVLTQIGEVYTKETLQKDIDNGIITKILTILTKEQYMQNCYTVERKKE